jgi:CheY-like chemotaxis protein
MSGAFASKLSDQANNFRKADGQKRRVLYAEDQASARIVTTALLERMGFDVEAVEDGELAFEKAMHTAYDVILLDIEMPVMDGVTAARNIRATADLCRETPILALSAFLADSTEHSVWRDAFDSALPKPANSNELQKAMQIALQGREPTVVKQQPHWQMLTNNLPPGVLANLRAAAVKEMNHLILAYASCSVAGDNDTANHCSRALKNVAVSFEFSELSHMLTQHETAKTAPDATMLLALVKQWRVH